MINKIFSKHEFFKEYHINKRTCYNFAKEMNQGYYKVNAFHNHMHIIDSMQAMHFLLTTHNLQTLIKKQDMFSVFVANIIHDYEHPGYSNQFVRTKHPIAIRYSDLFVLENHHLASAFNVILNNEDCNILRNLPWEMYQDVRKLIIEVVLSTDMSKHFYLMTTLKTKLGNNFPSDSFEDKVLILSVALRVCD